MGVVRKRVGFDYFGYYFMSSIPGQRAEIVGQSWSYSRLEYEAAEAWIDFLAFLVPKLGPKDP